MRSFLLAALFPAYLPYPQHKVKSTRMETNNITASTFVVFLPYHQQNVEMTRERFQPNSPKSSPLKFK